MSQEEQSRDGVVEKTGSNNDNKSTQLSAKEHQELGASRESWCAVEQKKEQDWCRATRKHYSQQFSSSVFSATGPSSDSEPRCTWRVNTPTHRERRHYSANCELISDPL